jgi:hypothetical protein
LIEHEQIAIRIQERAQIEKYSKLKRKELELQQRIEALKPSEQLLDKQLAELASREN